jgi:hypothetical protein
MERSFTRRSRRVNKRHVGVIQRLSDDQAQEIVQRDKRKREAAIKRREDAIKAIEKIAAKREAEVKKRREAADKKHNDVKNGSKKNNDKKTNKKSHKSVAASKIGKKSSISSTDRIKSKKTEKSKPESVSKSFGFGGWGGFSGSGVHNAIIPPARSARTEVDLTDYNYGVETSNPKQLDLVFCLDCTSSMGSVIRSCQDSIMSLANTIIMSEGQDVRISFIPYRDHNMNEEYCTKVYPFTRDIAQMQKNVNAQSPMGGGDIPEAVTAAMFEAVCLDWRPDAAKVVIFMADAPPHGIDTGSDTYHKGDPDGKDPLVISREMIGLGITVYSILVTAGFAAASQRTKDFFSSISAMTGGQCLNLADASLLADTILSGVKENIDMESKMVTVRERIANATVAKGSALTKEEADSITQLVINNDSTTAARSIPSDKLITIQVDKLEAAKTATSITELRDMWNSLSSGSSSAPAAVVTEGMSSRISRMAVARESRSTGPVLVECVMEGSKIRAKVISEGYDSEKNCQFPRDIREAGKKFYVDQIVDAGSFYRVKGNITPA